MNFDKEAFFQKLEQNNMQPFFVERAEEVVPLVRSLIPKGASVAVGGSVTLTETGVIDALRSGDYRFLDRYREGLTAEQRDRIYREAFSADVFLTSTNALTTDGELYNVDGNGNRVAALIYGPKSVIVVAGINKLVASVDEAVLRVKTIAAPKNCVRLHCDTPCSKTGRCISLESEHPDPSDGCRSSARICCHYHLAGQQRQKNRIKVILVGEALGY